MTRVSVKIVGASGQGINSIGGILAKGLKRSGYWIFGYREYPSLIKGGHASYQLDIASERVSSSETKVDVLIALNHHGLELNMEDVKQGGLVLHTTTGWRFSPRHQKLIDDRRLRVVTVPVDEILARLHGSPVLSNVLLTSFLWSIFEQNIDVLKTIVGETFATKQELLKLNLRCIDEGYDAVDPQERKSHISLPTPRGDLSRYLLVTGSQAMGLGAIHAGVRLFTGYPMTPSSPLLSFIASLENKTQMVVKQAEDEITAAQIVSGAMFMGTRALTATAGVGFDLMSETISLNAMIENPTVFVLAQRPGPATGLPTWTSQDGLLTAVNTAHGQFTHCVLSVSNSQDAFDLMPVAFNLAEQYQITVIVLTEKQIAEALYTQEPYDLDSAEIHRGKLVTDPGRLKDLEPADRYDPKVRDGISLRWLPGSRAATYCAQGDEHDAAGSVEESSENTKSQTEKRMRKLPHLKAALPEPLVSFADQNRGTVSRIQDDEEMDLLAVGWGSTSDVIHDVMNSEELREVRFAYLHYTYLWPLRTELLQALAKRSKRIVLIEQNYRGELGTLIRMELGLDIKDKILKYDGRPFFYDELLSQLQDRLINDAERSISLVASYAGQIPRNAEPAQVLT
jgi:2-oxoglutarate/2-oxoacid ferredoxin oxidoreductase subunit alpha